MNHKPILYVYFYYFELPEVDVVFKIILLLLQYEGMSTGTLAKAGTLVRGGRVRTHMWLQITNVEVIGCNAHAL